MSHFKRLLYWTLAYTFLALGALGAFLPVLPTTPFLILSAYFFSVVSPEIHRQLVNHPKYGPSLFYWFQYGVINRKVKYIATAAIALAILFTRYFRHIPTWGYVSMLGLMGLGLCYVWSRPEKRPLRMLIIGYGRVGKELMQLISKDKNRGALSIQVTNTSTKALVTSVTKTANMEIAPKIFSWKHKESWDHIEPVDLTYVLAPLPEEKICRVFWKNKKAFLGKVLVMGSSSCFRENSGKQIDEQAPWQETKTTRQAGELYFLKKGASLIISSGIYSAQSNPLQWIKKYPCYPNKYLNLVSIHDIAFVLWNLKHKAQKKESYIMSSDRALLWSEIHQRTVALRKVKPSEIKLRDQSSTTTGYLGKQLNNAKIKKLLPADFRFESYLEYLAKDHS